MQFIEDIDRGMMDRLLTSPTSRGAMMAASVVYGGFTTVIQSVVILGISLAVGARFDGGVPDVLVMLLTAVLLAAAFGSLPNGMALLVRTRESLIGFLTMLTLPLSFLSTAMLAREAMPEWIRAVADWNPVDWAVVASREAMSAAPDWGAVGLRLGGLAVVALALGGLATQAFGSYQRSL